ncbi:MAG: hypothetical protein ABIH55_03150 [Nanoarchaeota archaeon]|nr:hypothetical protein [Nanoarchaeota archaeon]MBU1135817.1 hypothetical protein [Nanoarchaeota archaeon]
MVLIHTAVSIAGGAITAILAYVIYRSKAESLWGWIASFFFDLPVLWLVPLGVTNIGNLMIVTHTAGILVFPIFLVMIDIILINLAILKHFSWLPFPKSFSNINKINKIVETLKKYNTIPIPVRVERVYVIGALAGIIHLAINVIVMGAL